MIAVFLYLYLNFDSIVKGGKITNKKENKTIIKNRLEKKSCLDTTHRSYHSLILNTGVIIVTVGSVALIEIVCRQISSLLVQTDLPSPKGLH